MLRDESMLIPLPVSKVHTHQLDEWSVFIIVVRENFQKLYGRNSDKNRKLYNGKIKTYLYQYLAKLPPKKM